MTTPIKYQTVRTEWNVLYKGELLGLSIGSEEEAREIVAAAVEVGRNAFDYQVVSRTVEISATDWEVA